MLMQAPSGTIAGTIVRPFSGTNYTVGTDLFVSVSSQQDAIALQSMGFFPVWGGRNNSGALVDPTANDDSDDDYQPFSLWLNISASPPRAWICVDSSVGAAVWLQASVGGLIATAGSGSLSNLVLSGLLTQSQATSVTAFSGGGQPSATALSKQVNNITTASASSSPYDSVKLPAVIGARAIWVVNSAVNPVQLFGTSSDTIVLNGNTFAAATGVTLPVGFMGLAVANTSSTWVIQGLPSFTTNEIYNTNTATSGTTLTGANCSGGDVHAVLNMTGTLGAGANAQLPTVANLVAATPNVIAGQTYRLRIANTSSANFAWTITTNTGWTLNGTMTIAQNKFRDFQVRFTSTSAATIRSVGSGDYD